MKCTTSHPPLSLIQEHQYTKQKSPNSKIKPRTTPHCLNKKRRTLTSQRRGQAGGSPWGAGRRACQETFRRTAPTERCASWGSRSRPWRLRRRRHWPPRPAAPATASTASPSRARSSTATPVPCPRRLWPPDRRWPSPRFVLKGWCWRGISPARVWEVGGAVGMWPLVVGI